MKCEREQSMHTDSMADNACRVCHLWVQSHHNHSSCILPHGLLGHLCTTVMYTHAHLAPGVDAKACAVNVAHSHLL